MTPRAAALQAGAKQYITGKPCRQGHLSARLVSNNVCLECNRLKNIARRQADPGAAARESKAYRERHPGKAASDSRQYYVDNRDIQKARSKAYRRDHLEQYRAGERRNTKARQAKNAARRGRKLRATPAWLTSEQHEQMKMMYMTCPEGYEVDHIYPLMGRTVCGLHVPWNLQHLTAEANRKKGNKLP